MQVILTHENADFDAIASLAEKHCLVETADGRLTLTEAGYLAAASTKISP